MIFVDQMTPCIVSTMWRHSQSCHMYTTPGNEKELHDLAQKIGLKLSWFQNAGDMPHYDLTKAKRKRAIAAGAIVESSRHLVTILRQYRRAKHPKHNKF